MGTRFLFAFFLFSFFLSFLLSFFLSFFFFFLFFFFLIEHACSWRHCKYANAEIMNACVYDNFLSSCVCTRWIWELQAAVCSFTVIEHRTKAQLQQICCRISRCYESAVTHESVYVNYLYNVVVWRAVQELPEYIIELTNFCVRELIKFQKWNFQIFLDINKKKYIDIQGVPGGTDQTSGGCFLC